MAPRCLQDGSRGGLGAEGAEMTCLQDGSIGGLGAEGAEMSTQDGVKSGPRESKMAPRWLLDGSRGGLGAEGAEMRCLQDAQEVAYRSRRGRNVRNMVLKREPKTVKNEAGSKTEKC
jgi:hypothetical protein